MESSASTMDQGLAQNIQGLLQNLFMQEFSLNFYNLYSNPLNLINLKLAWSLYFKFDSLFNSKFKIQNSKFKFAIVVLFFRLHGNLLCL